MEDSKLEFTTLNPPERSRTYVYESGFRYTVKNVTAICVRPSGSQRLNADGKLLIVLPGYRAIEIDADAWTF